MNWLTLALLAMFVKSAQNFAEKGSQKRLGSFLTMFLLIVISTIIIVPFTLIYDPVPTVNITFWLGVIGSVCVYMVAKPLKLYAIGKGDISEIIPLVSFSSLFSLILAWIFLGEIPTSWGLLGVSLIAVGGYLMNYEKEQPGWFKNALSPLKKVLRSRPQLFLFISLILGPVTSLFDKLAIINTFPRSPHYALMMENILIIPLLIPVLYIRKVNFGSLRKLAGWKIPIILGVLFAAKTLLDFSAISIGNIGYVAAIKQLSVLVAVFGGYFFLGERKLKRRFVSALIMGAGAFLIGYLG